MNTEEKINGKDREESVGGKQVKIAALKRKVIELPASVKNKAKRQKQNEENKCTLIRHVIKDLFSDHRLRHKYIICITLETFHNLTCH